MNKSIFLTIILAGILLVIASLLFVRFNPAELHVSETDISLLAQQIIRGEDHVTVEELSDRIIKARDDYLLIDLRPAAQYAERHIDTAVHMPLSELVKPEVLAGLPVDHAVIVYSNSTTNAAQAATILRLSGIPAYSLIGGYNHWSAFMADPAAAVEVVAPAAALDVVVVLVPEDAVPAPVAVDVVVPLAGADGVSSAGQRGHVHGQEGQLARGESLRGDRLAVGARDDVPEGAHLLAQDNQVRARPRARIPHVDGSRVAAAAFVERGRQQLPRLRIGVHREGLLDHPLLLVKLGVFASG